MFYYVCITLSVLCARAILGSLILSERVPINPEDAEPRPPVSPEYENRIVGGREADIEDYPYQVSFIVNNSFFCGGFIVSEYYILTAAHCAQNVDPTTVVLRAGSSWRKNGTIIPIADVIPHPEYDDPPFDKDVAVMKTVDPIPLDGVTMAAIALPELGEAVDENEKLMASGWGRTMFDIIPPPEYDDPPFDKDVAVMKTVKPIPLDGVTMAAIALPELGEAVDENEKFMASGWGRTIMRMIIPELRSSLYGRLFDVISHPDYYDPPFDKDVALIKTVAPIPLNGMTMAAIALPELEEAVDGNEKVMVSGWGRMMQGAPSIPERLMEVEIPVVSYFRCLLVYYSVLTKNMLCAGNFFFGGQGTCQGDSGGPAVQNNKVVGITSFGRGCAQPLSPSVFAKISAPTIREFIQKHTGL